MTANPNENYKPLAFVEGNEGSASNVTDETEENRQCTSKLTDKTNDTEGYLKDEILSENNSRPLEHANDEINRMESDGYVLVSMSGVSSNSIESLSTHGGTDEVGTSFTSTGTSPTANTHTAFQLQYDGDVNGANQPHQMIKRGDGSCDWYIIL